MIYLVYGVRELHANLTKALDAARRGKKVYITSRGKVVAVIARPDDVRSETPSAVRRLRRLALAGQVRLGKLGRIKPFKALPGGGVTAQILADRR